MRHDDRQRVHARPFADDADVAPADRGRMPDRAEERRGRLAQEFDLHAHVAQHAGRRAPDLLERGPARLLGIEVVVERMRIELPQQRVVRGLQVLDFDRRRVRLAQQVDEQRDARAVAIVDAGRVDDDRTRAGVLQRAQCVAPDGRNGVGDEAAGQREHPAAVGGFGDGERRGAHRGSGRPRSYGVSELEAVAGDAHVVALLHQQRLGPQRDDARLPVVHPERHVPALAPVVARPLRVHGAAGRAEHDEPLIGEPRAERDLRGRARHAARARDSGSARRHGAERRPLLPLGDRGDRLDDAAGAVAGRPLRALREGARSRTAQARSRPPRGGRASRSFRKRVQVEHRVEQRPGTAVGPEPADEDGVDLARLVEIRERPVHEKPEVRVVARQHQRVRLEREIVLQEREFGAARVAVPRAASAASGPTRRRRPCRTGARPGLPRRP